MTAKPHLENTAPSPGYVPAAEGADGSEDPAPTAVLESVQPGHPVAPTHPDVGHVDRAEAIPGKGKTAASPAPVGQIPLDFTETKKP